MKNTERKRILIKTAVIAGALFILLQFILAVRICPSVDLAPDVRDGDLIIAVRPPFFAGQKGDAVLYRHQGKEYYGRIGDIDQKDLIGKIVFLCRYRGF